jgi:hypothetical protein
VIKLRPFVSELEICARRAQGALAGSAASGVPVPVAKKERTASRICIAPKGWTRKTLRPFRPSGLLAVALDLDAPSMVFDQRKRFGNDGLHICDRDAHCGISGRFRGSRIAPVEDAIECCGYNAAAAKRALTIRCDKLGRQPFGLLVNSITALEGRVQFVATLPHDAWNSAVVGCFDWDPFAAYLPLDVTMLRQDGQAWHLDEVFLTLRGESYLLWRASCAAIRQRKPKFPHWFTSGTSSSKPARGSTTGLKTVINRRANASDAFPKGTSFGACVASAIRNARRLSYRAPVRSGSTSRSSDTCFGPHSIANSSLHASSPGVVTRPPRIRPLSEQACVLSAVALRTI